MVSVSLLLYLMQKSGIPFSQGRNFSVSNYSLYQISNFFYGIFRTSPQWTGCWPLSLLIIVRFPRFEIIALGKSYFLVLTCSLYSLSSQQITYNISFRILKPKSCIAPNKISKENKILWSKNNRHQCHILWKTHTGITRTQIISWILSK